MNVHQNRMEQLENIQSKKPQLKMEKRKKRVTEVKKDSIRWIKERGADLQ